MDILLISPNPPSRIWVRSYGFIQHLRQKHKVTVLVQVRTAREKKDVEVLLGEGYEIIPVYESQWSALLRCGMALCSQEPLQAAYAHSPQLLARVRQLLARRHFDIIQVEHLRGIASLEPILPEYPFVWDAVDCISQLWKKAQAARMNIKTTLLALLEQKRTEIYEQRMMQKVSHVLAISEDDSRALAALRDRYTNGVIQSAHVDVVPCGVDLDYFQPTMESHQLYNLVFFGKMSYHANIAAVHHLYQNIMPLVWKEFPMATVTIVGSQPPKSVLALQSDHRIRVTGYVDDLRPYVRRAHVMISPLVYSAGMQSKILEAMALGTPTVITQQSASALAVRSGYHTLVATDAQSFAQQAIRLMADDQLRASIALQGRKYVEQYHNWFHIVDHLVDIYRLVLQVAGSVQGTEVS
jgi:glycosyltransferase involved in cell wall biosynthesis